MKKLICAATIFALIATMVLLSNSTKQTESFTVKSLERINTKDSGYYLVLTDKGAYKNTDSLIQMKFNSSDLQSTFENGKQYTCTTNWFRVPLLSMYRNIISCK